MTGYVLRSVTVLNAILGGVFVVSACYLVTPLLTMDAKFAVPAMVKEPASRQEQQAQEGAPQAQDFAIVAEQNLFNPDRKIPVEKPAHAADGAPDGKPLPKPELVLYGTLISDGGGLAYMEDKKAPRSTPGRGKRITVLRGGDSLGGFMLKTIEADRVVMTRGEETLVVSLNEPKERGGGQSSAEGWTTRGAPEEKTPASAAGKARRSPAKQTPGPR